MAYRRVVSPPSASPPQPPPSMGAGSARNGRRLSIAQVAFSQGAAARVSGRGSRRDSSEMSIENPGGGGGGGDVESLASWQESLYVACSCARAVCKILF